MSAERLAKALWAFLEVFPNTGDGYVEAISSRKQQHDLMHACDKAKKALAAHAQRAECPEGWVMVPKVATVEMLDAAERALNIWVHAETTTKEASEVAYAAMIEAAPATWKEG